MEDLARTCCFTGHRADKLAGYPAYTGGLLQRALEEAVEAAYGRGYLRFYTGLCDGFDLLAAEAVLSLQERHSAVQLLGALPYPDFGESPMSSFRELQNNIRRRCTEIAAVSPKYWRGCFQARNVYMVDRSSLVIAAYMGSPGGTRNTLRYAEYRKRCIWNICANISPEVPEESDSTFLP